MHMHPSYCEPTETESKHSRNSLHLQNNNKFFSCAVLKNAINVFHEKEI